MTEELKKSDSNYAMVVDKDTDIILGCMAQAVLMHDTCKMLFLHLYRKEGVSDEKVLQYFKDRALKTHEMKWCDDPNCLEKKKK